MSTENGVAYPVTKGEATHIPEKILIPSNGVHRGSGTTFSAVCTVNPTDATQLKSENQRLLSELKAMKEQMQVVQGREKGITKAYLGVRRDLDHARTPEHLQNVWAAKTSSGKIAASSFSPTVMTRAQIIAPLNSTAGGGNTSSVKTSNLTSSANDTAVVASFNPIAGSHIFFDQFSPTTMETDEAGGVAAAAAARLVEARAKLAARTPSPKKSEAKNRELEDGLAAVKEKIANLQAQHPGEAAKYLASQPASLKWRCFLGVSPAQRAAIMLEMPVDERKLALSMLRPGERTIAERFLGIKTPSLAANTSRTGVASPNNRSDASLAQFTAFDATTASCTTVVHSVTATGPTSENIQTRSQTPLQTPLVGMTAPMVQADFVRDSRQFFKSGGQSGGFSLEERLFAHKSPPNLHSTNASIHAAVAAAVNFSAVAQDDGTPDAYTTNASVITIGTVGSSLQNTDNGAHTVGGIRLTQLQQDLQQVGGLDSLMGVKKSEAETQSVTDVVENPENPTSPSKLEGKETEAATNSPIVAAQVLSCNLQEPDSVGCQQCGIEFEVLTTDHGKCGYCWDTYDHDNETGSCRRCGGDTRAHAYAFRHGGQKNSEDEAAQSRHKIQICPIKGQDFNCCKCAKEKLGWPDYAEKGCRQCKARSTQKEPERMKDASDEEEVFHGMNQDEALSLSKSLWEMQRKVKETFALNPLAQLSSHATPQSSDNCGLGGDGGLEESGKAGAQMVKLTSQQKRALTSLPPMRPVPVPQSRGNRREDGSHTSLSGWEHVMNTAAHKVREKSPCNPIAMHKAQMARDRSPLPRHIGSTSIAPRRTASTPPRQARVESGYRVAQSLPPNSQPSRSPQRIRSPSIDDLPSLHEAHVNNDKSGSSQARQIVAEKSNKWQRYNSPPPGRPLPKPPAPRNSATAPSTIQIHPHTDLQFPAAPDTPGTPESHNDCGRGRKSLWTHPSPREPLVQKQFESSPHTVYAQEFRSSNFHSDSTPNEGTHFSYGDYSNYHSSGSHAPLAANPLSYSGGGGVGASGAALPPAAGVSKSVGFADLDLEDKARKPLDAQMMRNDVLDRLAFENEALAREVSSALLKGKATSSQSIEGRSGEPKRRGTPSLFARLLHSLGMRKHSQEARRPSPSVLHREKHSENGKTSILSASDPGTLTSSSLATILNRLHKCDADLSYKAAESLDKSSLPFDIMPLKSIRSQSLPANYPTEGEIWVDANWNGTNMVHNVDKRLDAGLVHSACAKMAEDDKDIARRAFALLMAQVHEEMRGRESLLNSRTAELAPPPRRTRSPSVLRSGHREENAWIQSGRREGDGGNDTNGPKHRVAVDPLQAEYLVNLLATVDPLLSQQACSVLAARGMLRNVDNEIQHHHSSSEVPSAVPHAAHSIARNLSFKSPSTSHGSSWNAGPQPSSAPTPHNGVNTGSNTRSEPPGLPVPPLPQTALAHNVPKLKIAKTVSISSTDWHSDENDDRDSLSSRDGGDGEVVLDNDTAQKILSILRMTESGLSGHVEGALRAAHADKHRRGVRRAESPEATSESSRDTPPRHRHGATEIPKQASMGWHAARAGRNGEPTEGKTEARARHRSTSNISNSLSPEEKAGVRAPVSPSSLQGDYDIIWGIGPNRTPQLGSGTDGASAVPLSPSSSSSQQKPSVISTDYPCLHSLSFDTAVESQEKKVQEVSTGGGEVVADINGVNETRDMHDGSKEGKDVPNSTQISTNDKAEEAKSMQALPWTSWIQNKTSTASFKPASFLGPSSPPQNVPRAAFAGRTSQESVVLSENDMRMNREDIRKLLASPAGKLAYPRAMSAGPRKSDVSNVSLSQQPAARHWGPNFC